jgi:AcrR family transcriptional regulator
MAKDTKSWQTRQQLQKAERKRQVIRTALAVFMEQGIEATTMNDVADRAAIGIASVYRYFKTKQELVIDAANLFWKEEIQTIYDQHDQEAAASGNGLARVVRLLDIYLELFDTGQAYFRFLEQFDQFVIRERIEPAMLAEYDQTLGELRGMFERAIVAGMRDGSIRADIEVPRFSSTIAVAMLAFAQKLVSRGTITPSDYLVDARRELELFIDMVKAYLAAR